MGRFKQLLVRKEREARQERSQVKRNSSAVLGQGPDSSSMQTTISLNCFADTETPSRWDSVPGYAAHKQIDLRLVGTWKLKTLIPLSIPPTNQKCIHKLIMPSLNHKISHYSLKEGIHSFESINLLYPPLPGKVIKLSFSTSAKALSLNLALVYRDAELLMTYTPPSIQSWSSFLLLSP